ncbi:hypothetical protein L917_08788, partial [Phytophthora nicotianae]
IAGGNLPFVFCECPETRRYTKLDPICDDTLAKYLDAVTTEVVRELSDFIPDKFASNISVKLVGCASHRLNLSLGMYLDDYEGILSKINSLMKDLKKLNNAARLRY